MHKDEQPICSKNILLMRIMPTSNAGYAAGDSGRQGRDGSPAVTPRKNRYRRTRPSLRRRRFDSRSASTVACPFVVKSKFKPNFVIQRLRFIYRNEQPR